ncbi:MAG TPA: HAD family phosphatase [Gemmataceae bacterium]|nr:HAD family phosphatase [Gemmataceae bacterium]
MQQQEAGWKYRAIAFDLDGVLINSEPLYRRAFINFLRERLREPEEILFTKMMGATGREAILICKDHYQFAEPPEELSAACSLHFRSVIESDPIQLLPGAADLLERLTHRQIPFAVATSSGRTYAERVLNGFDITRRLRFLLTGDDVRHGKPHPEIYLEAAKRFGIAPADMLVIEDSANGLRAAQAAGSRCIVVPHDLTPIDHVQSADARVAGLHAPELHRLLDLA